MFHGAGYLRVTVRKQALFKAIVTMTFVVHNIRMRLFSGRLPGVRCCIAALLFLASPLVFAQENIESFGNKWTVMGLLNYRYLQYVEEGVLSCRTNTPFELGLGVGYKWLSVSFGIKLPFLHENTVPVTESSFDVSMRLVGRSFSVGAFIAAYPSFFLENPPEGSDTDIDLELFSAGIAVRWLLSPENFSLRSVYNLDRKQISSAGSFWVGFDNFFFSIYSSDTRLSEFGQRFNFLYTGPAAGYAYTWVLRHGLFFNVDLGGSLNLGLNVEKRIFLFMPVLMPGITFGGHYKSWSFSLSLSANLFFSPGTGYGSNAAFNPSRLSQINAMPGKFVKRF